MSEYLLPGNFYTESEFIAGTGACGPNALSSILRWAIQKDSPDSHTVMLQLQKWVGSDGKPLCGPTGIMTTNQARQSLALGHYNFPIENRPAGEDLLGFCTHFFAPTPRAAVFLFLTNGQALRDEISGTGEDATGLQGHFIALVGYNTGGASARVGKVLPQGFWACDGDSTVQNPIVNGVRVHRYTNSDLCYYSVATLAAAQPADVFAVFPKPAAQPPVDPCADVKAQLAGAQKKLAEIAGILNG